MVRIPSAILPRKLLSFDKWTEVEWDSYWARLEGRGEIIQDKPTIVAVPVAMPASMAPAFAQGTHPKAKNKATKKGG